MARKADKEMSKIGVMDKGGEQILEHSLQQLETELEAHNRNLEDTKERKEIFKEQLARDIRIWEIMLTGDNYRRVTPVYKYETLDEYWELAKGQIEDKITQERQRSEGMLKRFDIQIDEITIQIEDIESKLNDMKE